MLCVYLVGDFCYYLIAGLSTGLLCCVQYCSRLSFEYMCACLCIYGGDGVCSCVCMMLVSGFVITDFILYAVCHCLFVLSL